MAYRGFEVSLFQINIKSVILIANIALNSLNSATKGDLKHPCTRTYHWLIFKEVDLIILLNNIWILML